MQTVAERIQQRRLQMIVHSFLYYELDESLVSDSTWSRWGKELQRLQEEYPEVAKKVRFAELFADWDASTGFHLAKAAGPQAIGKARYLLANRRKNGR